MVPVAEIPQPDGLIEARAGQGAPVRSKHHSPYYPGVAGQGWAKLLGPVPVAEIP